MSSKRICVSHRINGAPAEVQVIPHGRHQTLRGEFVLDAKATAQVMKAFKDRSNQMVIDYEHQTLGDGEAPAAGWIKSLINKGSAGIWAAVEWTPRASRYIRECEYRYLSPVFVRRASDNRVVELINAALTNQPAIDGMAPLAQEGLMTMCERGSMTPDEKGAVSPLEKERIKEERMKEVFDALGIDDAEGEDSAVEAIRALRQELDEMASTLEGVRQALGVESVSRPELKGAALAMKQAFEGSEEMRVRLEQSERKLVEREAGELVSMAMKQGKVAPAQRGWAMDYAQADPEAFRVFVAKAPVVVPLGEVKGHGARRAADVACPVQCEVNKVLGLSNERFMKYTNKEVG